MKFETTEHEHEALAAWLQKHVQSCVYWQPNEEGLLPQGASGGAITYCFTPTTIGLVTKVRCACGTEGDLTDYNDW